MNYFATQLQAVEAIRAQYRAQDEAGVVPANTVDETASACGNVASAKVNVSATVVSLPANSAANRRGCGPLPNGVGKNPAKNA